MSTVIESVVLLEPAAEKLQALIESVELDVRAMDTEHLESLLLACSVVERQADVHWAVQKVAPLVARVAQIELERREGHARLREALTL